MTCVPERSRDDSNLASNAVKFTEKGEVVVNAKLESRDGTGGKVHFEVRDTGIGIPLETQVRLFRSFEQADSSTTRQYGGSGLGWAISRKIVELMGGKIWIASIPVEGSTFHFTASLGIAENPEESAFAATSDLRGMPVLIIDDNATNRRILQETVGRWRRINRQLRKRELPGGRRLGRSLSWSRRTIQ